MFFIPSLFAGSHSVYFSNSKIYLLFSAAERTRDRFHVDTIFRNESPNISCLSNMNFHLSDFIFIFTPSSRNNIYLSKQRMHIQVEPERGGVGARVRESHKLIFPKWNETTHENRQWEISSPKTHFNPKKRRKLNVEAEQNAINSSSMCLHRSHFIAPY